MADSDVHKKKLNPNQVAFVEAYLTGDTRGHVTKCAIAAGFSPKTAYSIGSELLKKPEIQNAIQEWRDAVKSRGVADIEYRIARLDDLERRYWRVIEERAAELAANDHASGGSTGLIVKQHKIIGGGDNAQFVTEYVADTAVTKEIRAIYEDAAKEMGQRIERSETKLDATSAFVASLRAFSDPGHA
jgi:hypothetical protein